MKQILTILMSLQLLLLPMPKAHAEEVSIANQLFALSTTIVGSNIITSCKLGAVTPSLMAYFAGSLVFIAAEIAGAKAQDAFVKVQKTDLEQFKETMDEGAGDFQKKILEARLKDEEGKLGFVKKRRQWTQAVQAVMFTAMALAILEGACADTTPWYCPNWIDATCEGASSMASVNALSVLVVGAYGFATNMSGGGMVNNIGSAFYAIIALNSSTLNGTISSALGQPLVRFVTLGVAAGLITAADQDLVKIQKNLEDNIKKTKKVLADFEGKTKDPKGIDNSSNTLELGVDVKTAQGAGNVKRLSGEDQTKHCWGQDKESNLTFSTDACNKTLQLTKAKFDPRFSTPTLTNLANTGVDMAQAVARGDAAAADVHAATLASNAANARKITENLMKQFNEDRKKNGKKEIDFDKAIENRLAAMNKGLDKQLAAKGLTLASLSPSVLSEASKEKKDDEVKQEITTATNNETISTPQENFSLSFDEGLDDELMATDDNALTPVAHSLEDFETQESDILAKPEVSIFKQLSNRYFLNYKRIFDSKPPTEGATK